MGMTAAPRAACEQLHPGQPVKADDCFQNNKLAFERSWANWVRKAER
jgi:hypothetical protein